MKPEKFIMTKKSNYTRPSFLKIFACLFVGSAVVCGIWDSATGKTDNQAQTVETTSQTVSEATKPKKKEAKPVKKEKAVNKSQKALSDLVDKYTELSMNFSNECNTISVNADQPDKLQGSLDVIGNIQGELLSIDPESLVNADDLKDPHDKDYIELQAQAPLDKLNKATGATINLTNKFYDGVANQDDLDNFTEQTKPVQNIGKDIQILKALADNKDLWK